MSRRCMVPGPASQSTCRSVSCLSTIANGLSSRTVTAASRRRLRIGNSLTLFYSTIFAAAALADAQAKAQRRHELEQNIATVKEEVNELRLEEKRLIESIKTHRKRKVTSFLLQTRHYSAEALPRPSADEPPSVFESSRMALRRGLLDDQNVPIEEEEPEELQPDNIVQNQEDGTNVWGESSVHDFVEDRVRIKAIQRLALRQLCMRILLRPILAHDYLGLASDSGKYLPHVRLNTTEILAELTRVRMRMHALKTNPNASCSDLLPGISTTQHDSVTTQTASLDSSLEAELNLYVAGRVTLPELLLYVSDNLLRSIDPDRPRAFLKMIMTFSRTRQNDLVDLILRAILPCYFTLTSPLITQILAYFRKSKNLKGFDLFLQMLGGEGYPVNIPMVDHFIRKEVNGIEIVVPPIESYDPVVYSELVMGALRFNQPDRAEAWLSAARAHGFMDNEKTLFAFLRFYGIRKDWRNGVHTLQRALAYIASSTDHREPDIERLITRMVFLCDQCGEPHYANLIINATVQSGFDWELTQRQLDYRDRSGLLFERWVTASKRVERGVRYRPLWEKCRLFSTAVGTEFSDALLSIKLSQEERRTRMVEQFSKTVLENQLTKDWETPSAAEDFAVNSSQPRELQSAHQEEMQKLKDEISELRRMVIRLYPKYHEEREIRVKYAPSPPKQPDGIRTQKRDSENNYKRKRRWR